MNVAFASAWSAILALALVTSVHGQTPTKSTITSPTIKTTAIQPIRIVRDPATLQLQSAPLTNRVLSTSQLTGILQGPNVGAIIAKLPPGPPSKRALLVILENGGVMQNIDSTLKTALNVSIRTATCGNWEFELKATENIADLVLRVASQLAGNLTCIDPRNWSITNFNPYTWLDATIEQALENAVKGQNSLVNTQSRYDVVIVMEDANATPSKVITVIRQYAPTHVFDIHVLTHGGAETFSGYNGAVFSNSSFFSVLQADRTQGKPLYIRSVYQMNCRSGTLKDNWLSLGTVAVNGTESSYLNSMPHQYFHFLQRWLNGTGMSTASQKSWEDAVAYTRPVYMLVGMDSRINQSRLTTNGTNVNVTVTTAL